MGAFKSKLQFLILPAQSGKTRKVEDMIQIQRASQVGQPEDVHIWISANNKLLVGQTTARMQKDLYSEASSEASSDEEAESDETSNAQITGNVFSWTSGTKKTDISSKQLAQCIILEEVSMIVMCANAIRMRYLAAMLKDLTTHKKFNKNTKINIWIDEADQSINLWKKHEASIENPFITFVTLVSATQTSILAKYNSIRVLPYEFTHPECYRRLKDMNVHVTDLGVAYAPLYVEKVLAMHPELMQPGMRAFIPGEWTKQSHEDISELLLARGFAVIILNGTHKELRFPTSDEDTLDLKPYLKVSDPDRIPDEFSQTLSKLMIDKRLDRFPLAITGFMCVERGVTFQTGPVDGVHAGFLFDYGIVPPISDADEAYQTMARLFGNMGNFPAYKPCDIYSNSLTFERVHRKEEIAVNLARIVHEQGLQEVTKADVARAAYFDEEKEWELISTPAMEYKTLEEANAILATYQCRQKKTLKMDKDGFIMSSTTKSATRLSYVDVKAEMSRWRKTATFDVDDTTIQAGRMFICYKDMTDINSVVFIVRIIKRI
jgi:hypothetical protein